MKPFSDRDIKRLVDELRSYAAEFGSPGEAEVILRAAGAFEAVLAGATLDEAFGRKRKRGRPETGKPGKHFETVRRVFHLQYVGRSWTEICDEIEWQGDLRDLQRAYERELPFVLADLAKQLAHGANSAN
ncbi:hypothetical protein ACM41_26465 [Bradyrhizobium sp. CCBAU 21362]|uniref:hypothetical protein n=1 Tax=Bradyrhizobium sp. CCBAU 21362 TaxID=1325082 RepID=UPI002305ACB4|nr:hypothetical protein [Bradyrhizobium sp. CCBAU 21362]MDA9539647.1 hypothetical protein [Bradyrhizobium sp. CCBAU 21362]